MVAGLRAAMAEHVADPVWKCLVKRLHQASPAFTELWARHDVARSRRTPGSGSCTASWGCCSYAHRPSWLAARTGLRLVSYVPADAATTEALEQFARLEPAPIR